ncbi:Digalactosyldiacylglycerol synthase 1, chloroplastic [Orobanche gracilis]
MDSPIRETRLKPASQVRGVSLSSRGGGAALEADFCRLASRRISRRAPRPPFKTLRTQRGYKIFINSSISDVLCTATAEALAMGKFVVCADHPSNDFFGAFPNCLTYKTPEDFVSEVKEAMANEPQPLTPEQRYNLSWESATQRFMEYSELDKVLSNSGGRNPNRIRNNNGLTKSASLPNLNEIVDGGLAFAHYCLTGNEFLRLCTGAIPGTRDYDKQHSEDLHLLPPQVENPIYGW